MNRKSDTETVTDTSSKRLKRSMGVISISMLSIGAMIGGGFFVLIGMAAGEAGPALCLAFLANGLIAIIVGSCYAELTSAMPIAGGVYHWVKEGISPYFGFNSGWMSWFAQTTACALYAQGFGSFAANLAETLVGHELVYHQPIASVSGVAIVLLILYINFRGASQLGRAEIILTGFKIFILAVMVGFGIHAIFSTPGTATHYEPFFPEGIGGVLMAMSLTFVAFEGYEVITQSGEEARDPTRTIPRAIFVSIIVVVVIYLSVSLVMIGAVSSTGGQPVYKFLGNLGEMGLVGAAAQFVPYGRIVLLIAGMISTASALNATMYSSTRIAFAMGRDGSLFSAVGRVHEKRRTPHRALLAGSAIMIFMVIALPIRSVASTVNIMFLLLFTMVCATVIRLRRTRPHLERPFRVPFGPLPPLLGIAAGIGLSISLFHISAAAWLVAAGWIALGIINYLLYSRRNMISM